MQPNFDAISKGLESLPPDLRSVIEKLHPLCERSIADGEDVPPGLVFIRHKPESAELEFCAVPVDKFFDKGLRSLGKDLVAGIANEALDQGVAEAVILVTEAWSLEMKKTDGELPDSIADHPDRTEILLYNVMTPAHQWLCHAAITRNPSRVGPVQVVAATAAGETFSGRFVRPGRTVQ